MKSIKHLPGGELNKSECKEPVWTQDFIGTNVLFSASDGIVASRFFLFWIVYTALKKKKQKKLPPCIQSLLHSLIYRSISLFPLVSSPYQCGAIRGREEERGPAERGVIWAFTRKPAAFDHILQKTSRRLPAATPRYCKGMLGRTKEAGTKRTSRAAVFCIWKRC